MKVDLLRYTPDGEKLVASAAKLCYSPVGITEIEEEQDEESVAKFLKMLMSLGHASPIEHVTFTFGIEGVSRSLTHQLVRHRIASYSQQSQRYVRLDQFEYVIPPSIAEHEEAKKIFIEAMEADQKAYDSVADLIKREKIDQYVKEGMDEKKAGQKAEKEAIEDARYLFPNACETKIVFTMNARSLLHFFDLRCCLRAQWEIRQMAEEMLKLVYPIYPTLFANAGPPCVYGPCPEGAMTCGKIKEVRAKYEALKEKFHER